MKKTDKCEVCGKTYRELDAEAVNTLKELEDDARLLFEDIKRFFPYGDIHSEDWCCSDILKDNVKLESKYSIPDFNLRLRLCAHLGILDRFEADYGIPGSHKAYYENVLKQRKDNLSSIRSDIAASKKQLETLTAPAPASSGRFKLMKKLSKPSAPSPAEINSVKKELATLEAKEKQAELEVKVAEGTLSHMTYSLEDLIFDNADKAERIISTLKDAAVPMTLEEIADTSKDLTLADVKRVMPYLEMNTLVIDFKVEHHKYYINM